MSDGKMSSEDVDFALRLAGEARPIAEVMLRRHIAALEKERDTAIADSAALMRRSFNLCAGCSGSKTTPVLDADCYEIGRQPCTACEDIRVPHPGAALLEEHRKLTQERDEALTQWRGAKASKVAAVIILGGHEDDNLRDVAESVMEEHRKALEQLGTMRPAWTRLVAIAAAQGRSVGGVLDDAETHHKALVRARNEGLEALALKFDALHDECTGHSPHAAACHLNAADMARALKEPESD